MIDSMKNLKTDVVETSSTDSISSAFEALFREHWPHVYRLLCRLVGDPAEAEDLALETFVRLYQRYPLRENESNPGGWLHRVATNLGLQSIRSWKRRERYEMAAGKYALEDAPEAQPAHEARLVHRTEQPVARPVAGEDASGAVAAVRRRRQPHDQQGGRRVAEAGHRPAPVLLVGEGRAADGARQARGHRRDDHGVRA